MNTGLTNTNISSFAFNGADIFAGSLGRGVFLSTNNGASWKEVNSGLTDTTIYALAVLPLPSGGSNIFAATEEGVFLSTNDGANWTATALTNDNVSSFADCHIGSGSYVFAGTEGEGIFLSTDNGATWNHVNAGLKDTAVLFISY